MAAPILALRLSALPLDSYEVGETRGTAWARHKPC